MFASAVIIEDFENFPVADFWNAELADRTGTFFAYDATRAPLMVVDNPNKSGINTSDKVIQVRVYIEAPNSGILRINFTDGTVTAEPLIAYPSCPTCEGEKFDRLRFKYYKGSLLNRYAELEPNGSAATPKKLVQANGIDEWEYITFELENRSYQNFQIRVNRNGEGNGAAQGTADGDIIYVDDFEFFNSVNGPDYPSTAIQPVSTTSNFKCVSLGENRFRVETDLDKASPVRVELISIDGRAEVLYNQVTEGKLEVPFSVKNKGVYCVRTIIGNQSETVKIIY
jgi:hypothetical protein